jgi:homopolymeric O-antigen transport system ATP-binding protein
MEPSVRFDGVWKRFRRGERHDSLRDLLPSMALRFLKPRKSDDFDFWALKDVSFEVQAGQALGIVGHNGAGKSTILKLLTRIMRPTRGYSMVRGRVGALIEVAAGFHPDLTGRENVLLQGAIMGMRRAEIIRRFDEIVAFAGVEPFIDTPVKRYSSGMQARLGFSIAAHLDPDVLLVDEVLAVGDMAFQDRCRARMAAFRERGIALVFVSHNLHAIGQLCDQVLLLDHGAPVRLGPPGSVLAEYCRGQSHGDDLDGAVIEATMTVPRRMNARAIHEIEPGDSLKLEVSVEFRVEVKRATIGIVVWDLTRQLYVYGASSDSVGIPPIRAASGDCRTFDFTLEAHLTRGLYAIEVNVADPDRDRFLGLARGIRHFEVVERTSYDGVANLYLAGREAAGHAVVGTICAGAKS